MGRIVTDELGTFYYPSAEEYHLGMEGEICWSRGYSETYQPTVVRLTDGKDDYEGNLLPASDANQINGILEACVWDRYAEMRVPLLTKEQIEREGWTTNNISNEIISMTKGTLVSEKRGKIWYHPTTYRLGMVNTVIGNKYDGPCPTINHFRQISKLLDI